MKDLLIKQAIEIMNPYFEIFGKDEKNKNDLEIQLSTLMELKKFISSNPVTYKDIKIFNAKDINNTIKKINKDLKGMQEWARH